MAEIHCRMEIQFDPYEVYNHVDVLPSVTIPYATLKPWLKPGIDLETTIWK